MASRPGDPSRVTLRLITAADQDEFLGLAAASAGLHHPWMTLAATPQEFQDYLRRFDHVTAEGFLVCTRATGPSPGAPLVLLHGIGSSRRAWDPVIPALAGHFDVIAVNLPGFGDSGPLPPEVMPPGSCPAWSTTAWGEPSCSA